MIGAPSIVPCGIEGAVLPVSVPFLDRVIPECLNLANEPVGGRSTLTDHHVREADTPLRVEKLVRAGCRRYGASSPIVIAGFPVHNALANPCPFRVVMLPGVQTWFVTFPIFRIHRGRCTRRGRNECRAHQHFAYHSRSMIVTVLDTRVRRVK